MQGQRSSCALFLDMQKLSQDKPFPGLYGSHPSHREDPEPGLLNLHGPRSAHTDPQLCDFLESQFLDEEVKLMCNYLANLHRLAAPQAGLGEHLFGSTLQHDQEPLGPSGL